MVKHLTGLGKNLDIFLDLAMLTYNTYITPNSSNLSPFEIALGRKAKIIPELEITPDIPFSGTFKDAYTILQRKFDVDFSFCWLNLVVSW